MLQQFVAALTLREATASWRQGEIVGAVLLFAIYCALSDG